jgi:hypothetical protein
MVVVSCAAAADRNLRCGEKLYPEQEADLTHVTFRTVRIGCCALLATILIAGTCGDALAKTDKLHPQIRSPATEMLSTQQQARLGSVRYYGGPKSPMWRGPAEN